MTYIVFNHFGNHIRNYQLNFEKNHVNFMINCLFLDYYYHLNLNILFYHLKSNIIKPRLLLLIYYPPLSYLLLFLHSLNLLLFIMNLFLIRFLTERNLKMLNCFLISLFIFHLMILVYMPMQRVYTLFLLISLSIFDNSMGYYYREILISQVNPLYICNI